MCSPGWSEAKARVGLIQMTAAKGHEAEIRAAAAVVLLAF